MSKQVTFQRGGSGSGATSVVVACVPGTLDYGGDNDDRGGDVLPQARAGEARNGTCQVVMNDDNETEIMALVSGVGPGDYTIGGGAGDDIPTARVSYDALVDVEIGNDSVQVATITWKGTKAAA